MTSGGKIDQRSRQDRRKETGEDFTPTSLVTKMLNQIPEEVWQNSSSTFFDPACGNGNFLVAVKEKLLNHGYSEENVLSRIYGIDVMRDNVIETCERLNLPYNANAKDCGVSRTILCANTLLHNTPKKISKLFAKAHDNFSKFEKRQQLNPLS